MNKIWLSTLAAALLLSLPVKAQETIDSEGTSEIQEPTSPQEAGTLKSSQRAQKRQSIRERLQGLTDDEKAALRERRAMRQFPHTSAHQREHRRWRRQNKAKQAQSSSEPNA